MMLAETSSGDILLAIIALPLIIGGYFLPTIIAFRRQHAYKNIIFGLNIFAFTGFFWLAAFAWAVWPSEKSLADPVLGNPTGTGERNVGDTVGAAGFGAVRGAVQEFSNTSESAPVKQAIGKAQEVGSAAVSALGGWLDDRKNNAQQTSYLDQLAKLAELRNSGALTEEEFAALKAKLISGGQSSTS